MLLNSKFDIGQQVKTVLIPHIIGMITLIQFRNNCFNYEFSYIDGETMTSRIVEECELTEYVIENKIGFIKNDN